MVTYAAVLDVPRHIAEFLPRLLAAHRRGIGTPKGSRALGPFRQAVLVLRWFREHGCVHCLARDAGISQATGYRYAPRSDCAVRRPAVGRPLPAPVLHPP
nr:hypothetical protein StreXyl84_63920 [Streptomyces sp. Xyl84]